MTISTRNIRIASFNALRDQPIQNPLTDIERIIGEWHPHLINIQEGYQYIEALQSLTDYELTVPAGAKGFSLANPILFDPIEFPLKETKLIPVHGGKAGAYPNRVIQSSCFQWVDGSDFWMNNTQLNSAIERGGHPTDIPRTKLSIDHIRKVAEQQKGSAKGRSLSFTAGDFNIDEDADNKVDFSGFPNHVFREYGIQSVYDALKTPATFDTHGRRKIDVIAFYTGDTRVHPVWVEKLDNLFSDHAAVCAGFNIGLLKGK